MKNTYTIDWVQLTQEQIDKIILDNTKKKAEGRYFFPKDWEGAYYIDINWSNIDFESRCNNEDSSIISMWVFKIKEQLEKEVARRQAIVRIRKWVADNDMVFEPDWNDKDQPKLYLVYNFPERKMVSYYSYQIKTQNELPYFENRDNTDKAKKALEEDYKIALWVE